MGIYLNPGKESFQIAMNSEIFVDKTKMISYLNTIVNTNQRFVSVSRPRRFGKIMAADMICAYYDREADSHEMFEKTKLADCAPTVTGSRKLDWDTYLGQFDVVRIVMTDFVKEGRSIGDCMTKMSERILDDLSEAYPDVRYDDTDLFYSMNRFSRKSGRQFVIVIDEWDCVFREQRGDKDAQKTYLDFLRDWLKDRSYVALAYMTGILPIKKYGKHSALNMFGEYSMVAPMQLAEFRTSTKSDEWKPVFDAFRRSRCC